MAASETLNKAKSIDLVIALVLITVNKYLSIGIYKYAQIYQLV